MDRTEAQSTNATLAPQANESAEEQPPKSETKPPRVRPTLEQIAGFGVEMGIMAGLLEESEIDGPLTDEQREAIGEIIDGLRDLAAIAAGAFGVANPFADGEETPPAAKPEAKGGA